MSLENPDGSQKRIFEGEIYNPDGESYEVPGGRYLVEWGRGGLMDDYDRIYSVENLDQDFEIVASILEEGAPAEIGTSPEIESVDVESSLEGLEGMGYDVFRQVYRDVRSSRRDPGELG